MGGLSSRPWRTLPNAVDENLKFVENYHPQQYEANHLRIMLYGPVGAGKSSFINSVSSVLQGRVACRAQTDATSGSSYTKKYKTFKIRKDSKGFYSFVFNDIMGLEQKTNNGVHVEDVKLALRGYVKEGYQFSPNRPIQKDEPGCSSELEDRVHVLVCVVPADSISLLPEDVVKKMREVRLAASELEIPQLAILTKVDDACPLVKKDIRNVHKSKYLKEQVDKFSVLLGIPINSIFLVKNYETELQTNDDMDALILTAMRQMINFGEDFLNNM